MPSQVNKILNLNTFLDAKIFLFGLKSEGPAPGAPNYLRTVFQDTPKLPTYMIALTVFNSNDFKSVSRKTSSGKTVNYFNKLFGKYFFFH